MDFERIPEEVFLQILAYLDAEDLLSCSMVSNYWREMINKDWLWKRICNRGSETKKTILYLANEEKRVNQLSAEEVFNVSDGELEPPCQWRINYMRYAQLTNNIRTGNNCVSFKIPQPAYCSDINSCDCFVLFLINLKHLIEIWNVKGEPYQQDIIKCSLQHVRIELFEIVDDFLVVLQCNLLQVYKNNGSTFDLMHRRLFNLPQANSDYIPQLNDITDWYEQKIGLYPSDHFVRYIVYSDYFVGLLAEGDIYLPLIHIWNIKTGNKVKELKIPYFEGILNVTDIHFGSNNENVFIILKCVVDGVNEYNRMIEYNLKKQIFSNFIIELPYLVPVVIFKETFVVTLGPSWKNIIIWEVKTGKKLANSSLDYPVVPKTLDVYDSYIGFIDKEMNAVVMNFRENDLQTVCSIQIECRVSGLCFLHCNFILIEGFQDVSVWDIKKSCKLYTIDCDFYLSKNRYCTKLFFLPTYRELHLFHLW